MDASSEKKFAQLESSLAGMDGVVVAFSGGVDSSALALAAKRALERERVLLVTADSEVLQRAELAMAIETAKLLDLPHEVLPSHELDDEVFVRNDRERCYYCKRARFTALLELARERGFDEVLHGETYDDSSEHRPGARAAYELGVGAPLRAAGLTKRELREYLREAGLPIWDRLPATCLATRVAYGIEITPEVLARIESCEAMLGALGYGLMRVRHHGDIARIELTGGEIARAAGEDREAIEAALRERGYAYVTLDLSGYRSGSLLLSDESSGDSRTESREPGS